MAEIERQRARPAAGGMTNPSGVDDPVVARLMGELQQNLESLAQKVAALPSTDPTLGVSSLESEVRRLTAWRSVMDREWNRLKRRTDSAEQKLKGDGNAIVDLERRVTDLETP